MVSVSPVKEMLPLQSIAFVCVQHLFFTTIHLLESLVQLGACPDNIHIMGKSYSSCPQVADALVKMGCNYYPCTQQEKLGLFANIFYQDIKEMWHKAAVDFQKKNIKLVVILDDGGNVLANVPDFIRKKYRFIGVEQTTSGLSRVSMYSPSFPIIEVASSAVKQLIEPHMIANSIVKKLENILPLSGPTYFCAVIGMGCIGNAVMQKLISLNHHVVIYDKDTSKTERTSKILSIDDMESIFHEADYIFGCSGEDITENLNISFIKRNCQFISCSSEDKEFLTLLQLFEKSGCIYQNVFDNLECHLNNKMIKILRGGFPINLDNSGESVGALDIQLTRGLLLGGIIQGILYASSQTTQKKVRYMLSPDIQNFVFSHWRSYGSTSIFSKKILNRFQDISWIKENSGGIYEKQDILTKHFSPIAYLEARQLTR